MFKKIAIVAAMAATASFATWDFYPVQEAGKGSIKAGLYYDADDNWSQAGIKIGARYAVIQGLEISFQGLGYQFWGETDCGGCANGGNGLTDMTLGARYEVAPMITAFLDINLPIGTDDYDGPGTSRPTNDELSLYLGAQFSLPTGVQGFEFGAEGGIYWGFEHDNHERGLDIHMATEARYEIPTVKGLAPYIGLQLKYRLTESEYENNHDDHDYGYDDNGTTQLNLWLGAQYAIDPIITLKAHLIFRNEDYDGANNDGNIHRMDGEATGIYMGCELFF